MGHYIYVWPPICRVQSNLAQLAPQEVLLKCIASLLEVHETSIQLLLGMVNELAKQTIGGPARAETSICRDAEAMHAGSMCLPTFIDGSGVEPVQGLSNCNGPVICRVQAATFLMNGRVTSPMLTDVGVLAPRKEAFSMFVRRGAEIQTFF